MKRVVFFGLIVYAMLLGAAGAAQAQQSLKFEYKVVNITCDAASPCSAQTIQNALNVQGNDGWELVHVLREYFAQPGGFPQVSNQITAVFKKSNMATVIADYKKNADDAQKAIGDLKKNTLDAITSSLAPAVKNDPDTVAAIARQIDVTRLTEIERRLRALEERRPQ